MQDKPHKCKILIQWLNSKSIAELSNHGVRDRTTMIMQANQVVNKLKLCNIAKQQSLELTNKVKAFKSSFNSVIRWGLPTFWDGNSDLISYDQYKDLLIKKREDVAHISALSSNIKGSTVYKLLYDDYKILFALKHIFDELGTPSYDDHLKLEMMIRSATEHKYPLSKEWGEMMLYIKEATSGQQSKKIASFEAEVDELIEAEQQVETY